MNEMPERITTIAQELKEGQRPRKFRVRAILKWFGASRRGANVLSDIKMALATFGLDTDPAIDEAGINDRVKFVLSSVPLGSSKEKPDAYSTEAPLSARSDLTSSALTTLTDGAQNGQVGEVAASEDQLEPEPEDEQLIVKPDDRPVISQSSDWTISALRDKLDRGQLDLQPKFQREYVWALSPV